ncbi:3-beta-hydroxy-Delta(5)-steroid dehydrogenase [Desulfuromonas versatilis]|uniref:3-beta-hydroxy-Delta(5)-steroid dehydrogenase n=1 Tax=Desulfuromonas versatilis TaxID=2802975 RepID=A0ABM8HS02_9BACT|nr:NAD(P)H-binding protein [Desulfuromonas versatilis]BCR03399.1 3-beta-hydroxy-Delta(5)-steroid dehydrogenase [Desulfuromonas versatilis]
MAADTGLNVVTGAYSFTGRYIARRLLADGFKVKTLTGHPVTESPFSNDIPAAPFNFDDPAALAASLEGAEVLYNTYWIRLEYGEMTFAQAVANTRSLVRAAREVSVRHIVHLSAANASPDSPHPYFQAKAQAEQAVLESGIPCAILRPTILFGREAPFFNNLAWMLRKLPFFALPGDGSYPLQPVYVDDIAELAVRAGHRRQSVELVAGGPETFSFEQMVRLVARRIGSRSRLVHMPPTRILRLGGLVGGLVEDVPVTRREIDVLVSGLLATDAPAAGHTLFTVWLEQNADTLGICYQSELARHYR